MIEVSFVETMRGTLTGQDGQEHPVVFDVATHAPALLPFLREGHTDVRGVVRAPPWVDEAEVRGTMVVAPLRGHISYRLTFAGPGGQMRLEGHKSPSLFAPIKSMTTLPIRLLGADGSVLAQGTMHFDMKDLVPFLASWLPVPRRAQRQLDTQRRGIARRALQQG